MLRARCGRRLLYSSDWSSDDVVALVGDVTVVVDVQSAPLLEGATLEWPKDFAAQAFTLSTSMRRALAAVATRSANRVVAQSRNRRPRCDVGTGGSIALRASA